MTNASKEAYSSIVGELSEKRRRVLSAINEAQSYGATLFELVDIMKKPINEISGRVTELSRDGYIQEIGRRVNPRTHKEASVWCVTIRGWNYLRQQ